MIEEKKIKSNQTDKPEWKKIFNYQRIVRNLPFIFFLSLLAILYIFNGHYADKLIKKISKTEKSVKELEYEYKSIKSEVIYRSKPSEMLKAVEPLGLKELKQLPVVLIDSISQNSNGGK